MVRISLPPETHSMIASLTRCKVARIVRACVSHLANIDISHGKGRVTVIQIVVPFAYKVSVKAEAAHFVQFVIKTMIPLLESS